MNELSSHDGCMELNLEQIERYCGNQKSFNLVQNSRRRWGFSFHFRFFCWFQELQPTSDSGRSGLFKMLVWDECWSRSSAWILSRQIANRTRTHEDIQDGSGFRSVSIDRIGSDRSDLVHAMLGSLDRFRAILKACSVRIDQIGGVAYKFASRCFRNAICMLQMGRHHQQQKQGQ